ncbi:hypothetical protein [Mucilaginibacter dorajii]|uniref:Uncharacterized protein n=1 Tax=Mucilaginibacter dorajii TaxID=692994 RepID=A0ABP7QKF6_9SPHI|nr:hypothetical protein [Mucilaginibacter dorajii]MCS3734129.1 hypothetical protein [Mucilaginibacter dorajii]
MMVTAKNTYYIMAVNLLYTLTVIASITLRFNDMPVAKWLQVLNEIVYVTPMLYVVMMLKYLKEDGSIIATYKIFIGIDIFISLYFVVVKMTANNVGLYYLFFLLSIIAGIIFTIQSARIQNKWLGYPLLTYGLMFLFVILLQLIASIIYSSQLFKYVSLTEILIPAMTFYILFKIARYLASEEDSTASILT